MSRVRFVVVALAVGFAGDPASAQAPDEKALTEARSAYQAAMAKAEKAFVAALDAQAEVVRKSSRRAEEKVRLLDRIKAEKAEFEEHGWYPWSSWSRLALLEFMRSRAAAEKALSAAYDKVIDGHTLAKNDEAAAAVVKQKKEELAPTKVGRWEMRGINWTGTWVAELYSNGHYSTPDGKAVWTFEKGMVVLTQPESGAPNGVKVIRWNVSAEGTTLEEQSNLGGKSSGKLANMAEKKE